MELGDVERARDLLCDGLALAAREIGRVDLFIHGFAALGVVYASEDPARAARLLGRARTRCARKPRRRGVEPFERRVRDETEAKLRARLGEHAYAAAYADGRALALEDALPLALRPRLSWGPRLRFRALDARPCPSGGSLSRD